MTGGPCLTGRPGPRIRAGPAAADARARAVMMPTGLAALTEPAGPAGPPGRRPTPYGRASERSKGPHTV